MPECTGTFQPKSELITRIRIRIRALVSTQNIVIRIYGKIINIGAGIKNIFNLSDQRRIGIQKILAPDFAKIILFSLPTWMAR